jgi:hypothetical protein
LAAHKLIPPEVATVAPCSIAPLIAEDNDLFDCGVLFQRLVDLLCEWKQLAAAPRVIRGEDRAAPKPAKMGTTIRPSLKQAYRIVITSGIKGMTSATRSPLASPSPSSALATRFTSAASCANVSVRTAPSSPSQMQARLPLET